MLAFIDESGDPGLKIDKGSSKHFFITMVVFEDHEEALAADQRIALLRREMNRPEQLEFRFNKMHMVDRKLFLNAVRDENFFFYSIAINKANLTGPGFSYKESFYKYACRLLFENAKPHLDDAIITIDGSGSREFRQQLSSYLRRKTNNPKSSTSHIKKVKLQDSKKNNLVQLADMVCGSTARSFTDKSDAADYRKIISHREINVQFWPK